MLAEGHCPCYCLELVNRTALMDSHRKCDVCTPRLATEKDTNAPGRNLVRTSPGRSIANNAGEALPDMADFRKSLGPGQQEAESPGIKEEVELPQIKEEEPEPPQQQKREKQLPIKKEEEEQDITRLTGDILTNEDVLSEASRGAELPSCSSSIQELRADNFIAPPSNNNDATSPSPYTEDDDDDSHKKVLSADQLCECSQCGKTYNTKSNLNRHMKIHTPEKPFYCSVCGQRFTLKIQLTLHTRTHTVQLKLFPLF
ncbi:zinc finger protein with KRAB and SCAN domains 1-like isoform X2 [Corythoichthys intestinalis]|uniref:zinc finger protein with KRAB and SCAN domains 1-like isoform X2 n=1 Tax=Corythoichthys intestinalis TaxID=161448 RepID=UPI0025A57DF9|nr:zinc finger protein with KRAB and SCAN domains 1-like isoform X2 [Corythoichthys intestinalis]